MHLCGLQSGVHGAGPCPRRAGHQGECYWWLPWEEPTCWRVIVYSGPPNGRRRRCMGAFVAEPQVGDVGRLVRHLAVLKTAEVARRTPQSEPAPRSWPVPLDWMAELNRRGIRAGRYKVPR